MIFVILIALFLLNINSTHIKENRDIGIIEKPMLEELARKTQDPKMLYSFCESLTYETFKWEYYDMCSAYFSF